MAIVLLPLRIQVFAATAWCHILDCRMNLDPIADSGNRDEDLWQALEIAQLREVVSSLEGGLGKIFTAISQVTLGLRTKDNSML